jgi:predicted  nucleic acid-binding Zn-ribbon protein
MEETRTNPKTLWQEKKSLAEKIERISNAINENNNSIQESLQGTPYTVESLVQEIEQVKNAGYLVN